VQVLGALKQNPIKTQNKVNESSPMQHSISWQIFSENGSFDPYFLSKLPYYATIGMPSSKTLFIKPGSRLDLAHGLQYANRY
jgi:hypothetical protein